MKIVIVGGHMAPALAVIEKLPKDISVVYIGRKETFEGDKGESLEYQVIQKKGIPFINLPTGRLIRNLSIQSMLSFAKVPFGLLTALSILKYTKPDVVLSFGGYLSVPVGVGAKLLGIPLIIHEQTLEAGAANKFLASYAKKVCVSYISSEKFFPKNKTILTGNPLMESNPSEKMKEMLGKDGKFSLVCIVGGSGGSHAINILIEKILPELLTHYRVLHQTGNAKEYGDYERLASMRESLGENTKERYYLIKFIQPEDVQYVFEKADVLVSRSGMNTVATLLTLQKPVIFIPLPIGQKNEQQKNAEYFVKNYPNLSHILSQDDSPELLLSEISAMIRKGKNSQKTKPERGNDAAEKIISIVKESTQ